MYKSADYDYEQLSFVDFNESCGMQLDRDNEWILHASRLPWKAWEAKERHGFDYEEERRYISFHDRHVSTCNKHLWFISGGCPRPS